MIEQALERRLVTQPPGPVGVVKRLLGGVQRVMAALACMRQRRRQRLALARLDPRLLDDIGVSAEAARNEAAKPPWRG